MLDLELGVIPNFWNTSKMATSKTNSSKRSSIRGNKKFPCLSHRYICLSGHPTNTLRNLVEVIRNTAIWLARSNNSDEIATLQERETFELHSKALYHSIYTHRYLHVNSLRCEFSLSSYIRGVGYCRLLQFQGSLNKWVVWAKEFQNTVIIHQPPHNSIKLQKS